MNGLLIIGTIGVTIVSLVALLASIGDWKVMRFMRSLPEPSRRNPALTVVVYHTTLTETLTSVAALHALDHSRLTILIVDNATLGKHAHALRIGLRQLYHRPIRLYALKSAKPRRQAILAASRHIATRQLVAIIDGGDIITNELIEHLPSSATLRRIGHPLRWLRGAPLGPSFAETAETLSYSAGRLLARSNSAIRSMTSNSIPAGTIYADSRALRQIQPLQPLTSALLTTASPSPRSVAGLTLLLVAMLSLLALFGHVAYLAASLQTIQPLLLYGLISLFATSVLILWDQTTQLSHKAHLLLVAPLSGIILPVSLLILTGRSFLQTITWPHLRLWQLLARTGRKHS